MTWFEKIVEVIYWLAIAFSPILASVLIGFLIYLGLPDYGKILSYIIISIGIISGIILANWATKKYGASNFIARLSSRTEEEG